MGILLSRIFRVANLRTKAGVSYEGGSYVGGICPLRFSLFNCKYWRPIPETRQILPERRTISDISGTSISGLLCCHTSISRNN